VLYTIHFEGTSASISSTGAELQSLSGEDGQEVIWQGDPDIWSGRAPILFPIVGALKDNQYSYGGNHYQLPRHGFARRAEFTCIEQTNDSVALHLPADSGSLQVYPWQFELTVRFSVQDGRLLVRYSVANRDTGAMIFTIGSHPAFALQHAPSEYAIQFSETETLERFPLTADGLLLPGVDYLQQSDSIALTETIFDDDALVFKDIRSQTISLCHGDKPVISVDTGGAPHLGIWAKPAARFVCIEPWFGFSDEADGGGAIEKKPAMQSLAAGEQFTCDWSIALHR
jgi:galactose mutarotase-like enzyme